jgi:indole-3-glycerol phosphate synthase
MGVLDEILASKRLEIERLRAEGRPSSPSRPPRPHGLRRPGELSLIAEIKRRSPSAGALSTVLSPEDRGRAYEAAGAAAISVLTDGPFFDGSYEHLAAVASAVSIPVLCKDFVLDEVQLDRAAAAGASLVLLIVRILDDARLGALVTAARARGLEPLVEVATHDELARALAAGSGVIGVNARDLDTLVMDRARAADIVAAIPAGIVAAHLSGLATPDDVRRVPPRADAALLGEALMRLDDPTPLLRDLASAARAR